MANNNTTNDKVEVENKDSTYVVEEFDSFDEIVRNENILRGIYAYGFERPSSIQKIGVRPVMDGKDLIAQSQSGTGKTGTFGIGLLDRIEIDKLVPQGLILAPTRELAEQINEVITHLGSYLNIKTSVCIGGKRLDQNFKELDEGVHIVIGTPGRVKDLFNRYVLVPDNLKAFILDEADEMLSKGFMEQIYDIFQYIPKKTQVCLFSATMPVDILDLTDKFMNNPIKLLIKKEALTLEGIKQHYINVERDLWKFDTLCDLYKSIEINQAIIYCNRTRKAEWITANLRQRDYMVSCMHSKMSQDDRKRVMNNFRSGESRVLVATNIIARGIDVQQVSIVINYDLPRDREVYIHRIGRSGRFGRKGLAINFITNTEMEQLRELETFYNTQINPMPKDFSTLI